eukprot:gene1559-1806_t
MEYTLIYHLADDTVEIFSSPANNSGREQFPRLLRRALLPKAALENSSSFVDDLEKDQTKEYYNWREFFIGCEVNVYARSLVIVDADQSTRDFYANNGLELGPSERQEGYKPEKLSRVVPPHNGFGSEEDSLQSCVGPLSNTAAPRKKFGENKILSFVAELVTSNPEDVDRRFVITFFVTDGTIKVHEIPARNSGFVGGVFLSRSKLRGPDQEYVTERSLYLGGTVILQKHKFHILQSNESTLKWMEARSDSLPKSNVSAVLDKLRCNESFWSDAQSGSLLAGLSRLDRAGSGRISGDALRSLVQDYGLYGDVDDKLTEHEVVTLIRGMGGKETGEVLYEKFVSELLEPSQDD